VKAGAALLNMRQIALEASAQFAAELSAPEISLKMVTG
jgi:hypothetical protein